MEGQETKSKHSFWQRLKELGFDTYDAYLNSEHWKTFRKTYRESSLPQTCRCCGSPKVQLHHITYARLGVEELEDVVPLCARCHMKLHEVSRASFISLADFEEAIRAIRETKKAHLPPYRQLTKQNSTKKQRKTYARQRRKARNLIRQRSENFGQGSQLVNCEKCGRRVWQDGLFCSVCGSQCRVVKTRR